jgi:putative PEP-CTERM system TPR-repeat lipoprotein
LLAGVCGISLLLGSWTVLHRRQTDYVTAGQRFLAEGQPQTALIELNNAVHENAEDGRAQLMLARLCLQLGDPISAQRAARAAIALAYKPNEALTELLLTYLVQRRDIELLHEFPDDEKAGGERAARIEVGRGEADIALQEKSEAALAFSAAIAHDPHLNLGYFGEEDLALSEGNLPLARHYLELGRAVDQTDPEGLLREGQLLLFERKPSDALKLLTALTAKFPSNIIDRLTLVQALIANHQIQKAQLENQKTLKEVPNSVQAIDDQAALDVATRNWSGAQAALEKLSPFLSQLPNGEYIQALTSSHFGLYAEAAEAAARYEAQHPGDPRGLQLTAEVAFQAGDDQKARGAIMSVKDDRLVFANLLVLRGADRQENHEYAAARGDFARASFLDSKNKKAKIALVKLDLFLKDPLDAVKSLTPLTESEPNNIGDWRLLCQAALDLGEVSDAQNALNRLRALEGQGAEPELSGEINLAMYHLASAQTDFEMAAHAAPQALAPQIMLARISGYEGNETAEEARLKAALRQHANNPALVRFLADVLASNGKPDQALQILENAHQSDPNDPLYVHQILVLDLAAKRPDQASAFLRGINPEVSGNRLIMDDRIKIDLIHGKTGEARSLLEGMSQKSPHDTNLSIALSTLDVAVNDPTSAVKVLDQALLANPHDASLMTARAELALRTNGLPAALLEAKNWARDADRSPQVLMIPGSLYLADKKPSQAADAFEEAYRTSGLPGFLVLEIEALNGMPKGSLNEAQQAQLELRLGKALDDVRKLLLNNPRQPALLELLAQVDINSGKFIKARAELQTSVSVTPNDADALNNLAYVDDQLHDPEAEAIAARAYFLSQTPQISDTFGWILFEEKKYSLARVLLRNAYSAMPSDPAIASHYAATQAIKSVSMK